MRILSIVLLLIGAAACILMPPINWAVFTMICLFLIAVLKKEEWQIYAFLVIWSAVMLLVFFPMVPVIDSLLGIYIGVSLSVLIRF